LAQILSRLDIDEQIPPELYKAVAEILAFVYSLNERYRDQRSEIRGRRAEGERVRGLKKMNIEHPPCPRPSRQVERPTSNIE
jgi:hypothetical protein